MSGVDNVVRWWAEFSEIIGVAGTVRDGVGGLCGVDLPDGRDGRRFVRRHSRVQESRYGDSGNHQDDRYYDQKLNQRKPTPSHLGPEPVDALVAETSTGYYLELVGNLG